MIGSSICCKSTTKNLYDLFKNQPEIRLTIGPPPTLKKGCRGAVYLCDNLTKRQKMVVKVLPLYNREYEEVQKIIQAGGHPNIVDYYGVYDLQGFKCIVMEYIDSDCDSSGLLRPELKAQLCSVVSFCDVNDIVFQNDNPQENQLFMYRNGKLTLKLIDFDPGVPPNY